MKSQVETVIIIDKIRGRETGCKIENERECERAEN